MPSKQPKKKEKVVLIDGRNLLYRSLFSHKGLAYKGQATSAIYGYPSILKSIIFKLKPKKVFVVWDGLKSKHRLELLPDYKKRDKVRLGFDYEDLKRQEKIIQKMLRYLGISQVYHADCEADDLIYGLVERYKGSRKVYIVSSDKDFNQCIEKGVVVWNDKDNQLVNQKNCKKLKGYNPEQTVDYLSLLGDSSDNIPGYRGIGEAKSLAFLEEFGSIKEFLKNPDAKFKGIDKQKLKELYKVNSMMIDLKVHWDKHLSDIDLKECFIKPAYNLKKFKELCEIYSINSLKKNIFVDEFKSQYYRSHKKTRLKNYGKRKSTISV